ncbi:MAG: PIN domain-containing protein [Nanoarchaeota archaeon]
MLIVLDSNILISAIIKDRITRKIIMSSDNEFLLPEYSFIEIRKHENYILSKSQLSKEEFGILIKRLLKYIKIVKTEDVLLYQEKAMTIMGKIDEDDVIFIATALTFKCPIWSDDSHFKLQKDVKIYDTKEMADLTADKE